MLRLACVIDSDIAIDYLRTRDYAAGLLAAWTQKGRVCISALTYFEVYQGTRPHEERHTAVFLNGLFTVDTDISVARQAGNISRQLASRGVTMGAADAIIAATALELGVPLVTNNVRHYSVPGLTVVHGKRGDSFRIGERRRRYSAK